MKSAGSLDSDLPDMDTATPTDRLDNRITLNELEEALIQIWRELSAPSKEEPGSALNANMRRNDLNDLELAATQFRAAADDLLATTDQALADLREAQKTTRTLLDQIDARLGLHG